MRSHMQACNDRSYLDWGTRKKGNKAAKFSFADLARERDGRTGEEAVIIRRNRTSKIVCTEIAGPKES